METQEPQGSALAPQSVRLLAIGSGGFPSREVTDTWPVGTVLTSLPATEIADKLKLMKLLQSKPDSLKDGVNLKVDVVHITLCRDMASVTEEEEARPYTRYIVTDPNGIAYQGSGVYLIADLMKFVVALGNPPYDPPIPVTITPRKCRGSHTSFNLVPDIDEYLKRLQVVKASGGKVVKKQ